MPYENDDHIPTGQTCSPQRDPIKDADLRGLSDLIHSKQRAASYSNRVRALILFKEEGSAVGDPDAYKDPTHPK